MAINITREEIRADILEITTQVVRSELDISNRAMRKMINEDLEAMSRRIDGANRRLVRHVGDPGAHSPA